MEEDGNESNENVGPFSDVVARESKLCDEALMGITDSTAFASALPVHTTIAPLTSTNKQSNTDKVSIVHQGENSLEARADGMEKGATQDDADALLTRKEIESMMLNLPKAELRKRGLSVAGARVDYVSASTLTSCEKKKDLLSSYEFRKETELALTALEEFCDMLKPEEENSASRNTVSRSTRQSGRRAKKRIVAIARIVSAKAVGFCRVSDRALHPLHGALKCRLNRSVPHFPGGNALHQRGKSLRYSLHRWNYRYS